METAVITRNGKTLDDQNGRPVGWIGNDGKFRPSGEALSADQLRAILALLEGA
jgi:hypothetical protein